MATLCCISLTIAARIIAALGLSTAILMINVTLSEFLVKTEDSEFLSSIKGYTLIGLNWIHYLKTLNIANEAEITFICLLCYSILLLIVSGLLAVGTIYKKAKYALPWMYLQMLSIADQVTSLIIILTSTNVKINHSIQLHWRSPLACVYLMISMYFWIIVFSAREDWIKNSNASRSSDNANAIIAEAPRDSNVPKTPSYLAQNQLFFQPVIPAQPNKPENIV